MDNKKPNTELKAMCDCYLKKKIFVSAIMELIQKVWEVAFCGSFGDKDAGMTVTQAQTTVQNLIAFLQESFLNLSFCSF